MREPEKLQEALDLIAKGIVQPTKIAAALGVPYRTYRSWMVRSNRGDERFLIEVDGEDMQWAKAITLHTRLAMFELRGLVTQYSIFGDDEISYKDGQVVWALDPVAAALSIEDRLLLGYREDALLEINGALQPVKMHKRAPIALQLRLLEATFKDLQPHTHQSVDVKGGLQVGVGYMKPVDYTQPPPVIPPLPPVPQIEATDAEFTEVGLTSGEVDPELAEMLGPIPVSIVIAPVINMPEPVSVDDPEPIIEREPAPVVEERVIRSAPTAAETPPPQVGPLAPPPSTKSIPAGWRQEWEKLQSRAALPDKLNRG